MDTPPTGPATNGRLPPRSACGKHPSRLLQYGPVYSALCNKSAGIKLQTEYTRHTIKGCPHKQPKPREPYILQLHDYPQASLYDQGYEQSLPKVPDDIRDIGRIIAAVHLRTGKAFGVADSLIITIIPSSDFPRPFTASL